MDLRTALSQGEALLKEAAVPVPKLTAEVLLCHALRKEREFLYAYPERELREVEWIHYGRYLHERMQGKPTQYITKKQEFYGRSFRVSPAVLIPRPETEHLIEVALDLAPAARRAVDVGCGSGAIGVTFAIETGRPVVACDISAPALAVACANAKALSAPVTFVRGDLLAPFADAAFDLILSNPPYVPEAEKPYLQREVRDFEPHVALFGGPDGLSLYARLAREAAQCLAPGGWLLMELGFGTYTRVQEMLGDGWSDRRLVPDLAGIPRVIAARRA